MDIIVINKKDNVGVVLEHGLPVPYGHKIALKDIAAGELVIKYGAPIGEATADITEGEWVHTHNLRTLLDRQEKTGIADSKTDMPNQVRADVSPDVFYGYRRPNGRVGVRNELWIVPTVGCVRRFSEHIAYLAREKLSVKYTGIDGVICLSHPYGCSRLGKDNVRLRDLVRSLCMHPNAAGVLLIGLGCEHNTVEGILDGIKDRSRIRWMTSQHCDDETAEAMRLIDELAEHASGAVREKVPVSELVVGVKCGGSDGLSGISANPLTGRMIDRLTSRGGTGIMSEVPEMFGAEHILMGRCSNKAIARQTAAVIESMKQYYRDHGELISENPSPGNKDGGITTLEEKSIGCVQKGGSSQVKGVVVYGHMVETNGLNIVESPGNDLVSSTAIAVAGAQIILFTTGRGTPMGSIVPTIKISSNNELYEKKKGNWIDFNAGKCLAAKDIDRYDQELWEMIIDVASGNRITCSEKYGSQEFEVFQTGVTL